MNDCNTCRHHVQAGTPPAVCGACLDQSRAGNPVPRWQPIVEHAIEVPKLKGRNPEKTALDVQIGGDHYKTLKIQPVEFCIANKMDFFQKDIIKYISRRKGDKLKRIEDLKKARHYLDMYIEAIEQGNWG